MAFKFNQPGGGSNTPTTPLFGAGAGAGAGGASSIFGNAGNTTNTGSNTPAGGLFGSGAATSNSGSSTLFGSSNTPATSKPAGGLFGAATSGTSTAATGGTQFGGLGGGAAKPPGTPGLFGGGANAFSTGASVGGTPATSTPSFGFGLTAGSSTPAQTPAPNKTFALPSTTPAGPPPGNSLFGNQPTQPGATSGTSLFGATKPAAPSTSSAPNMFGSAAPPSSAATPLASTPGGSNIFGGFGNKDASANANKSTPTQLSAPTSGAGLFPGAAPPGTQGTQATPKTSLFGNLGSTTPSATPASKAPTFSLGTSSQPASNSANTLSSGGDKPAASATDASKGMFAPAKTGSNTPGGGSSGAFGFPTLGGGTPAATTATPAATTTTAAGAGTSTTSTSGPSMFSTLGGGSTPASSGPASTSAQTSSLFSKPAGNTAQPSAATTTGPAVANAASTAASGDAAKSGLGSSTVGPAPSAQSRLKNKSMDEIITRWAADLSKYQKEFQQQAETVAKWDRALVENSDKVKQLYAKTFTAERDAAEVERQLTNMEENQAELDSYLDRYEKEIENMMRTHGVSGRSDGLRGPDQERERTYKLAEKLQDRLNELNKDLTEMIEEINRTSQDLSKTGKPDDPLTKVVRVLNSQLSQLQLIDQGAQQLEEKIAKAHKETQRVGTNGWNGLGTDPAEDFYRSMRGGRTDRFGGVS